MNISAHIIQDSINANGTRITTFELEYPRFIHSELMTHRVFSRNAASSRAIPVSKVLEMVKYTPAMPVRFGANQAGMQDQGVDFDAGIQLDATSSCLLPAKDVWRIAARVAANYSKAFADAGYHKQVCNRITEPYQWMKTVVTSTDYENWFWLRDHKDADPTICALAEKMYDCFINSAPKQLKPGEWHVPYIDRQRRDSDGKLFYFTGMTALNIEDALKISASCCAQTSYRKTDDTLEKAELVFKRLIESEPVHASPIEHQAMCFDASYYWPEGVTHRDRKGMYYSGNFKDWIQYRQLIPNNAKGSWQALR